jgi:succinoglycan biosynthesis protein ExoM
MHQKTHICVCACTYKRPEMLKNLLSKLQTQEIQDLFHYSIIIVDNDKFESARKTVEAHAQQSKIAITYVVEPEQNIALARNKAVDNSHGDYIAFIDDDEFPEQNWLLNLYNSLIGLNCDGVLGPVVPYFEGNPPQWLVKGGFCERKTHKTGTVLHWDDTRTGNVLLSRSIFEDKSNRFDPLFGKTGGEDQNFFMRMIDNGRCFVWCNEAVVHEIVPPERWKRGFYLRKYMQMGGRTGELAKKWSFLFKCKWFAKAMLSIGFYSLALPFSTFVGHHVFMKCLVKNIYYLSWFVGFWWRPVIKFRY